MTSRAKNIRATMTVVALMVLVVCFALFRSPSFTPSPLPDPNGYDDFVQAGELLVVDASGYPDLSLEELQPIATSNALALSVLREGLAMHTRVPLQFTMVDTTNWANELSGFKALASALCAEARCEFLAGSPDRAAETSLETIRFGVESSRGGLVIHRMVGIAIQAIGFKTLNSIVPELDALGCKRTVKQLDGILSSREPLSAVAETERSWSKSIAGIRDLLPAVVLTRSLKPFRALVAPALARCEQNETGFEQTLLNMAARAYELENDHAPESAADLVPDYLKAIPVDPATGSPLQVP